jgi:hypothetical protein
VKTVDLERIPISKKVRKVKSVLEPNPQKLEKVTEVIPAPQNIEEEESVFVNPIELNAAQQPAMKEHSPEYDLRAPAPQQPLSNSPVAPKKPVSNVEIPAAQEEPVQNTLIPVATQTQPPAEPKDENKSIDI